MSRSPFLIRNIWNNFINSLKPRKISGNFMGEDYMGNKYYEIPAQPSVGKRRPSRYFTPPKGEADFDHDRPAEWDSWLRLRREEPPTEEEVKMNLAIIHMKQKNAAALEHKAGKPSEDIKGMYSFPTYEEYDRGDDDKKK